MTSRESSEHEGTGPAAQDAAPDEPAAGEPVAAPEQQADQSLGSRAISGGLWIVARFGAENVLRLASNMILTRLLLPEAFGAMALIQATLAGLAMFADVGISSSVVQNRREDAPFLNTVWTLQVIRGAVLWLFAVAMARPMAAFYDMPELTWLIMATGLTSVISGFNSIKLYTLRRHLRLRELAFIETGCQFATGVATVAWAWFVPSVWALVWGTLIGTVIRLVTSHVLIAGPQNRFAWERAARRDLLDFGKWIFVSTILTFLAGQSDRLIFGKLMDVATLGVFSIALILAAIPTQIIWQLGNLVVFPALSHRKDSPLEFRGVYYRTVQPVLAFGALAVAGLAATAPDLVQLLYDPRYAEAGWMVQILAVAAWLRVPQATSGVVPLAMGEPRWLAAANAMKFASMLVLLPVGFQLAGSGGAIVGLAASEFFRYATFAIGLRRFGLPAMNGDLVFSGVALASGWVGFEVARWLAELEVGVFLRLLAASVATGLVWLVPTVFLLRSELPSVIERIRQTLGLGTRAPVA